MILLDHTILSQFTSKMQDKTFYFVLNNKRSDELFDHEFSFDIFEDQKLENKSS